METGESEVSAQRRNQTNKETLEVMEMTQGSNKNKG